MDRGKGQNIKMIIWDLDETFWKGTISEEGVIYSKQNHDIVIKLSERGIVNSICSKNDFSDVKSYLSQTQIWDYFVFPSISWNSKGEAVKHIIQSAQLREENVLFIDDNRMNLKEAQYFCPQIQIAEPSIISELLSMPQLKGKSDKELSRIRHYKILENKVNDQRTSEGSNIEFLKQSDIKLNIDYENVYQEITRISELIERTNQLNFTKSRIGKKEVEALVADEETENAIIRVKDKYGDYGIVGFFALKNSVLEHFVFSCRILNMGVEQYVFNYLDNPSLNIQNPVATELKTDNEAIDWIEINSSKPISKNSHFENKKTSIFFKGGCDLDQCVYYLKSTTKIKTEFNYVSSQGVNIHNEHTQLLRIDTDSKVRELFSTLVPKMPILDKGALDSQFFDSNYDVKVYSLLMNYTQGLYRYKENTQLLIPYGNYYIDLTKNENINSFPKTIQGKEDFFTWFQSNFEFVNEDINQAGLRFINDIRWLLSKLKGSKVILINGAEVPLNNPNEPDFHLRYAYLNSLLEQEVKNYKNAQICDMREIISSEKDLTNNLRHYKRESYFKMATVIGELIHNLTQEKIEMKKFTYYKGLLKDSIKRLKSLS